MLKRANKPVRFLTKSERRLWNVGAVLAVALMLLWPAFVNGEPFYMTDTPSYLRGADAAVYYLTGERSAWTNEYLKRYPSASAPPASSQYATEPPVVLAGRSIYYGLLLYVAQWLGNFWAAAMLQALLVATAIAVTVHVFSRMRGDGRDTLWVIVCGVFIAACTSAGYFASYLLPDVFGALGLLAFGHLVFLWDHNGRTARGFWFALLVAAILFHMSNFFLIGVLAIAAIVLLLLKLPASGIGLGAVAAALMTAAAGQVLFSLTIKQTTGEAPIAPPFVAARIINDGPGYEYLLEHCPTVRLIFCRAVHFENRISDSLLWSTNPKEGIFMALTPSEQRLAAAQQSRFVLAVLEDRPFELIGSSVGAFFRQVTNFDLGSFNYSPSNIDYFERKIPSPFIDHARRSKAYHNSMPVRIAEWTTLIAVLASLLAIFSRVQDMIRRTKRLPATGAFLLFMVLGALLNAAICGAISTPKGRYQMRVIWVLPLVALASRKLRSVAWAEWSAKDAPLPSEPKFPAAQ